MEGERPPPPSLLRARFRQFKNPPQPHMCIADTLRDSSKKLYINVLGWQKIPNPKQYSDPIPLYGGMRIPQGNGCGGGVVHEEASVFAVMVNPDILRVNGKHAANPVERDALVNLLCDFVEAMNPEVRLARRPTVLAHRDLAGELKDVWLAVQYKRDQDKAANNHCVYKVYDIDGVTEEACEEEGVSDGAEERRYAEAGAGAALAHNPFNQPLRDPRDLLHQLDSLEAALGSPCRARHMHTHNQHNNTHKHNGHSHNFYPVFKLAPDKQEPPNASNPPQHDTDEVEINITRSLHQLNLNTALSHNTINPAPKHIHTQPISPPDNPHSSPPHVNTHTVPSPSHTNTATTHSHNFPTLPHNRNFPIPPHAPTHCSPQHPHTHVSPSHPHNNHSSPHNHTSTVHTT